MTQVPAPATNQSVATVQPPSRSLGLGTAWRLSPASAVAAVAAVAIVATLLPATASAQYFGKNRIQYRDFDWKIYHSTHFDVYYYEAEADSLEKTVSMAESAYDELSRAFDHQIQDPTPLIIYQTHSAFQQNNIILNGVPEGAQAFATPSRFRMVLPLDMPDGQLMALIKHELTHIFQYHILFRGKLGSGLRGRPPQWFMEGMASYFGDDEGPGDKKYMVDAVVNDTIPSVETLGGGFFAYRFGHAVFDYIEERWGKEAVLDLIYEFRNTLGSRIGKAIERTFRMDVEDFDSEFRRWARKRYLPALLASGEPGDFGKPFRLEDNRQGQELSPAASPSGDLVASITTDKGELDISLFDAQKRRRLRNLTKGLDKQIRNLIISTSREVGSDLAFSPDGNFIAAFGRREAGRSLVLIDVIKGGVAKIIDMQIEQQRSPVYSPDGRSVAFAGNLDGQFDIFSVDLDSLEIVNLTNDEFHDVSPAYSPDGRWLAYASYVGDFAQVFRMDLQLPDNRYQLTEGEHNNKEPVYSPSGKRIYFSSDRTGSDNIYGLDFDRGEVTQYTNAVTACDRPTVLPLPAGGERLVYQGYWKGRYDLYTTDVEEPLGEPEPIEIVSEPTVMAELERFEPDIEVSIDESNIDGYNGGKFFLEDAQNYIGVDSDGILIGRVLLSWSDYLGDRRIIATLGAVDTFSDFDVVYLNQRKRRHWAARVFDRRVYQFFANPNDPLDFSNPDRQLVYEIAGADYTMIFPLSYNNRFELGGGYFYRQYELFSQGIDTAGNVSPTYLPRNDHYPQVTASFVSDSTIYTGTGPVSGRRVRITAQYAFDTDPGQDPLETQFDVGGDSNTLFADLSVDARFYQPLTRRSNFAFRLWAHSSDGNSPNVAFIGGFNSVRGFPRSAFSGDSAFTATAEYRFPLIDILATPVISFQGIRGVLFADYGGSWFKDLTDFDFGESEDPNRRFGDAIASYGFGLSARLLGMSVNWDFAKRYFLETDDSGFETDFWIGTRF